NILTGEELQDKNDPTQADKSDSENKKGLESIAEVHSNFVNAFEVLSSW
ncbi:13345_t:CDS:1, partial [Gigaspora rosea]